MFVVILSQSSTLGVIEKIFSPAYLDRSNENRAGKLQPKWSCNAAFAQPPLLDGNT